MELGDIGKNGCTRYLKAGQCYRYAKQDPSLTYVRRLSRKNYPKGCFVNTKNNKVYFNTHATGSARMNPPTRAICKTKIGKICL